MKVALIHNQYVMRGGMERYLALLVQGFTDFGDSVTVLTARVDPAAPAVDTCRLVTTSLARIPRPLRARVFASRVARLIPGLDCDVSLSLTRTWGQNITVCGGTHRAYLMYLHRWTSPLARDEIKREQRAYDSSRRIVAHSRLLRDEIVEFYDTLPEKITVLHPPTDSERFRFVTKEKRRELRRKYGMGVKKRSLLFVSTGHQRKGLRPLLEALALLPPDRFELVIVGSPAPAARKSPYVRHLGYLREIDEVYAAADFTILPSYYEPFGLVVTESLLCGTPVLVSDRVGAADLLGPKEGRVFPAITPEAIAATILEAADMRFEIAPDFAQRNGLTLARHIKRLRETITTA